MGNHGTSANSTPDAESSWRLNELTEGAVTIGVGSLFQYLTTRIEKHDFLRKRRLGSCKTLKGRPLKKQARAYYQFYFWAKQLTRLSTLVIYVKSIILASM